MTDSPLSLQHAFTHADSARKLCGHQVRYHNIRYTIADILWEDGLMILHAINHNEVQNDSFGRPNRVVPSELHIQLRNSDGTLANTWQELELITSDS
ncbi:MAG: hypothetical protein Q9M13_04315 [Mariprofundales bacterium]|nr:hypothetical protein [Mariprofundales bacterium]